MDVSDISKLQHDNLKMINYLLMSGNEQQNEKLKEQKERLKRAVFYNEIMGMPNHLGYLYDKEAGEIDKIALFVLQNERMLKVFSGHQEMLEKLKEIYQIAVEDFLYDLVDDGNIILYSYESCSLLIAGKTSIATSQFESLMKEVYDYLASVEIGDVQLKLMYQCAVVGNEKDALQKAESSIQYGIAHKSGFVVHSQIADKLVDTEEEKYMLNVLREAIAEDGIFPYFQGIYDNREQKITIYESLMRIKDSQGHIYFPNQFLDIAKNYNLYDALSVAMVKKVMSMFGDGKNKVSLNLNVQDIYSRDMMRIIFNRLKEVEHPEDFIFELVESEEVKDYEYIIEFANRVHKSGAKIAIDDFGSGFSNLLHLIRINTDYLKIDGEIIRAICEDVACREFLQLITEWCKRQNKCVIAEFVENEAIHNMVVTMGISHSQGYFISKPKPWEEADR